MLPSLQSTFLLYTCTSSHTSYTLRKPDCSSFFSPNTWRTAISCDTARKSLHTGTHQNSLLVPICKYVNNNFGRAIQNADGLLLAAAAADTMERKWAPNWWKSHAPWTMEHFHYYRSYAIQSLAELSMPVAPLESLHWYYYYYYY